MKKYLVAPIFTLVVAIISVKEIVAPWTLRWWLNSEVSRACATCKLSMGSVHLSFNPVQVTAKEVKFTAGPPSSTEFHVEAGKIQVPFSFLTLFSHRLRIGKIAIERPTVEIIERDSNNQPSHKKEDGPNDFNFEIEGIDAKEGTFSYERDHLNHQGIIRVSQIHARVGAVGNSTRLIHEKAQGQAIGCLENSGHFILSVGATMFEKTPQIDVDLKIKGQNLGDVNRFFLPNDGLELRGELVEGQSQVKVKGDSLSAVALACYKNFKVLVHKKEDRGVLSTFIQNQIASLKMRKQNLEKENAERTGRAKLRREPGQSIVSFILNGMKEAALQIPPKGEG